MQGEHRRNLIPFQIFPYPSNTDLPTRTERDFIVYPLRHHAILTDPATPAKPDASSLNLKIPGYFLTPFLPAPLPPLASAPPAACAAFLAAFSCSALASRSRRCSGVSPSSRPLATGRRACALCRSRSRWSPRAAPRSGQGQHHPKTHRNKRKEKKRFYQDLRITEQEDENPKREREILRMVWWRI